MPDKPKWFTAYGSASHMHGVPAAQHHPNHILFAFREAGHPYVVLAAKITRAEAARWVRTRLDNFHDHPDSREGFEDKVRRKAIAAHGVSFTQTLRGTLPANLQGEWDTMFNRNSHTSSMSRLDTEKVLAGEYIGLRIDRVGKVRSRDEHIVGRAQFNDGRWLSGKHA